MSHQLTPDESLKLAELRRIKRLATGVLILCFAVLVAAKLAEARWPDSVWLGYIAAFAEAATIGGIADWYAVVVLFKHPLNLPIPHTAIIASNQTRIADNLGSFIERNFLSRQAVAEKLNEIAFADEMSGWLADRKKADELARFVCKLIPQLLASIDKSGIRRFAAERVRSQLDKTEIAPVAANLLDAFVKDGRHNRLMDDLIAALNRFLNDDAALSAIRKKVQEELPSLLYIVQAEGPILRRIVKAASSLLEEIRQDPDHELRDEFEHFLMKYVRHIKRSKRFSQRAERMKAELLDRPEFAEIAERMWQSLRLYIEEDVKGDESAIVKRLSDMFVDIGTTLAEETRLKAEIDREMVRVLSTLVESQKSSVSAFISQQVRGWDFAQLTMLIEANVGKDLQYIRFNGMLVGGIAGVILHTFIGLVGAI